MAASEEIFCVVGKVIENLWFIPGIQQSFSCFDQVKLFLKKYTICTEVGGFKMKFSELSRADWEGRNYSTPRLSTELDISKHTALV